MQRRTILKSAAMVPLLGHGSVSRAFFNPSAESFDVIVVGSGAAGLAAAIAAREAGARRVAVLEKFAMVGGHTLVSSGSVSAAFRDPKAPDPEHRLREMEREILSEGGPESQPELVKTLVAESESAVRWLADMGVRWNRRFFQAVGGVSARSLSTGGPLAGYDYVQTLMRRAQALSVEFLLSTRAIGLAVRDGRVTGVYASPSSNLAQAAAMPSPLAAKTSDMMISSASVVLATGGFTANPVMRSLYAPDIAASLPTTANPQRLGLDGATGDGIVLGAAAGAALVGMNHIQVIPYSGGRLLDHVGGEIWVNDSGRRFVYEGSPFRKLRECIAGEDGFWAISDSQTSKGGSLGAKLMQGTVRQAASIEQLARDIHVNAAMLRQTIERWNTSVANGYDSDFNVAINHGTTIQVAPFFYGRESWSVHFTCGGLAINPNAEVLRSDKSVIEGLFAAGETTGGIHGEDRLGGNSLIDCFVFGRIAGHRAAALSLEAGRCGTL